MNREGFHHRLSVKAGENYGWPLVTHSREYSGGIISDQQSRPGMVDPKLVWTPAIAPSGLVIYDSDRVPQWQGDLFAGGLVSRDIRHIELDKSGNVVKKHPSISVNGCGMCSKVQMDYYTFSPMKPTDN
jgi:glucose/arabinose dehydrogenase